MRRDLAFRILVAAGIPLFVMLIPILLPIALVSGGLTGGDRSRRSGEKLPYAL